MESISKWAVNWKNGMKINSDHFLKERIHHSFKQSISSMAFLNDYNFGLIHYPGINNLSYKLYNNRITIDSCLAITRGGWLIHISDENNRKIESLETERIREHSAVGDLVQVFVRCIPDKINEFGVIDGESFPANYPDASCSYALEFQSLEDVVDVENYSFIFPIALLKVSQNGVDIVDGYVPPSTCMKASEELKEYFDSYNQMNFKLARTTSIIAQNLSATSHSSYLKSNIKSLCQNINLFLADQLDHFMISSIYESPLNIFLFYKRLSRLINASLVNMENRSEMLGMMAEWAGIEGKELKKVMDDIGSINYNHLNIKESFDNIESYIKMIDKIFENLSKSNI